MIVYDLKCAKSHVFEAWFRDSAAYDEQAEAGEVTCPVCGSKKVEKAPMAPRVAKGRRGESAPAQSESQPQPQSQSPSPSETMAVAAAETEKAAETMAKLRELRRTIEQNFDYVGPDFAEEARKIHYGEADPQNIYGETSDEEARKLSEEGVSFGRLPWPTRQDS